MPHVERLSASRYVQPLREGGSLPAVVDTEDGLYVVKFRGAGQGAKVLVSELIVGGIAMRLGLPTPDLALVDVSSRFGRSEPDPEIQELIQGEIDKANKAFARVEQVKKFRLIEAKLTAEDEELTPTMKLKRKLVNEKYRALIEEMYVRQAA